MVRTLGVIGYGKMGSAIVNGAIKAGVLSKGKVGIYEISPERKSVAESAGLALVSGFHEFQSYDSLLLAIKPKEMPNVLDALKECIPEGKTHYISIAAGVKIDNLLFKLGPTSRITRVMPNIAASVNQAASVYAHSPSVSEEDHIFTSSLLESIGLAIYLKDESLMDIVTGISGSGPAYFFLLMDVMIKAGVDLGLPEQLARLLTAQTCLGAGVMARESSDSLKDLIKAVASPGGTTEEALRVMESRGFSKIFSDAILAAIEKSKKMYHS